MNTRQRYLAPSITQIASFHLTVTQYDISTMLKWSTTDIRPRRIAYDYTRVCNYISKVINAGQFSFKNVDLMTYYIVILYHYLHIQMTFSILCLHRSNEVERVYPGVQYVRSSVCHEMYATTAQNIQDGLGWR